MNTERRVQALKKLLSDLFIAVIFDIEESNNWE